MKLHTRLCGLSWAGGSRWQPIVLLAALCGLALFTVGCGMIRQSRLRQAERDLAPVLALSNAGRPLTAAPAATGDPLFDRYALAVEQRIAHPKADNDELDAALLPDTELAAWEAEFGDDPDYWELRYCCACCGDFTQSADGRFIAPTDFLQEARQRGVATANTLMLLYLERCQEYDLRFAKLGGPPVDQPFSFEEPLDPTDPEKPAGAGDPARLEQAADLQRQAAAEARALLSEAIKAAPTAAWPRYLRSFYWLEQGQPEAGLADLAFGNAQANTDYPLPFPLNTASASLGAEAPAGSASVCGAVFYLALGYPEREYARLRQQLQIVLAQASPAAGADQLNVWQGFACRNSTGRYSGNLPAYLSLRLVGQIADYWEEQFSAELTPTQLETLQRTRGALTGLRQPFSEAYAAYDERAVAGQLARAVGDRGYYLARYFGSELGARLNAELLQPVFADLRLVRYPELALPLKLKQYEPAAIDETRRYRPETVDRGASVPPPAEKPAGGE